MFIFVLLAAVVFTLVAIRNRVRASRGIFIAYLWVSTFIPYLLANTIGIRSLDYVYPLDSDEAHFGILLCLILLVCVSFQRLAPPRRGEGGVEYTDRGRIARAMAIGSLCFAGTFLFIIAFAAGSLEKAILAFSLRTAIDNSIVNYALILSGFSSAFAVFAFRFAEKKRGFWLWAAILINLYILYISGGRAVLILFFVSLFFIDLIKMPFRRFVLWSIPMLAIMTMVSYVMVESRLQAQGARSLSGYTDVLDFAGNGLASIDDIALAVRYVEDMGHHPKDVYLPILALPIPRAMWPEKPIQFSRIFRAYRYGDTGGGLPPGLLGESYIAGGIIWVVLMSLLYGLILARLDRIGLAGVAQADPAKEAIASVLGPTVAFALYRGGLDLGSIRLLVPTIGCLLAWLWIHRMNRPRIRSRRLAQRPISHVR